MERRESELLVSQTAIALNIEAIIGQKQTEQIIEDSDGHPYVIKISLGEIANKGQFERPARLIVRKDDILDALFDRTYANLSPLAARIFLTLSRWRSLVPQLGVEAVISRHGADGGDAEKAIDELVRMSVVERSKAEDGSDFLGVPLAAAIFANKKFETSPQRELIDSDVHLLQDIGATTSSGLREGIGPRISALFRRIARRIGDGKLEFEAIRPALEFVARSYNPAWWLLADLQSELEGWNGIDQTAEYVRQFLEGKPSSEEAQEAWQRLIGIYRSTNNVAGGCSAFLRIAEINDPPLTQISSMANWLNSEREIIEQMDVAERGALFRPVAALMERHIKQASATELSRLAWLHLHAGDTRRALEVAKIGIEREPGNSFCLRLIERLSDEVERAKH